MIDKLKARLHQANSYYTGWRPALGWIAMLGCFIAFVLYPVADLIDAALRRTPLPPYPMEQLMVLVAYALGKAWIRHKDKEAGVATINTHPYEEAGEKPADAVPDLNKDDGAPWKTRS